ncbi:CocE/NonD family hydrolase [Streptomyces sp. NPDC047042]|uniref:CocE/NonD family hydrolase n=1 Tax=Streptomyces sp. NPDC047042 TaxID=3154807 RepID=UPI0034056954
MNAEDKERPSAYPAHWKVAFGPSTPLAEDYQVGRETTHLEAGTVFIPGGKPLPCDVVWERDIPITLRDGVVIYTDVLRPADQDTNLPALVSWSPYGKSLPAYPCPPRGVPPEMFSGLGKFEGADAAFWLEHGYALVNPDARGAGNSEGDIHFWGSVESHDGYDVVEWAAEQSWSSGKVALYGASWLAISQWGIAATRPPHLAAIAPWNGIYDAYRTHMVWGGIPNPGFFDFLQFLIRGANSSVERIGDMSVREPLLNEYWEDKIPDLSKVTIPAYIVMDGVTGIHPFGASEAFRRLGSTEKWFRINNTHEWYDQYTQQYQEDVLRFFDRYLKDIDNGWETTPRVRASIINAGGEDFVDVPFTQWPVHETRYQQLYLDAHSEILSMTPPTEASSVSYPGAAGAVTFTITFEQDTTLLGYMSARLWVEAQDADDMDLFLLVEKLDADGNLLAPHRHFADTYSISPPGAPGRLRVSLRELDPDLSTDFVPIQAFRRHRKLAAGEIVPVDIGFTPRSYYVEAGQQLRLTVAGYNVRGTCVEVDATEDEVVRASRVASEHPRAENTGSHVIHTGPGYLSYLKVPVVENPH